ncbi:MAG: hypothetical protein K2K75_09315 [Muribaculaceae bacterium]|nr:hypothetical protein [Muribaculaceae bacterium]MDE6561567.1 hypothetical protein [Muribaculaceae bacterium]
MKKIVLALAVVFSVALVSCGNKQAAAEDTAAAEVVEAVEVAVDSVNDSTDSVTVAAAEVVEAPAAE